MNNSQETFLQIVRLGIGNDAGRIAGEIDWNVIQTLAEQHGLSAVVVDGIEKLPETQRPPIELLLQWIGEVLQNYEYRYQSYCNTMAELSSLYQANGIKMMILKGYACGLNWPKPEHRPYGDIDIYLFGKYKEADELLNKSGIQVDDGLHHHTTFSYKGEMVENHFDFVNVHSSKENREIEEILKELANDDSLKTIIGGQTIYLPSPNLHALFLLKHARGHFVSTSLSIRQLLDWAFFVQAYFKDIDWKWLAGLIDKYHMHAFFNTINAICVGDLGFDVKAYQAAVQFDPALKDKVLNDILNPMYGAEEPRWLVSRLIFKYKRWKSNAWKRRMCYEQSDTSMFIRSAWKHLLKPASI